MVVYISSKLPIDSEYRLWIHKNHQAYEYLSDSTCQAINDYRIVKPSIIDLTQASGDNEYIIALTRDDMLVIWTSESSDTFTDSNIINAKLIIGKHILCSDETVHQSDVPSSNSWNLITRGVTNISSVGNEVEMYNRSQSYLGDIPIINGHRNVIYTNGRIVHNRNIHPYHDYCSWKLIIDPKSIIDIANYQDTNIMLTIVGMGQLAIIKILADAIPIERIMLDNEDVVSELSFRRFIVIDGIVRIEDTNGYVYDCTLKDNEVTISRLNELPCKILYEGWIGRRLAYTKSSRRSAVDNRDE